MNDQEERTQIIAELDQTIAVLRERNPEGLRKVEELMVAGEPWQEAMDELLQAYHADREATT